jgi:hypothetical protein
MVTTALTDTLVNDLCTMGCIEGGNFVAEASLSGPPIGPAPVGPVPFRWWVLTDVGATALSDQLVGGPIPTKGVEAASHLAAAFLRLAERPLWKDILGELWWRGELVKRFRSHATDQRCILKAFQAAGWESCIDNPLVNTLRQSAKKHLHETIKSLNRGQKPIHIRFRGDGTGQRLRWEPNQ